MSKEHRAPARFGLVTALIVSGTMLVLGAWAPFAAAAETSHDVFLFSSASQQTGRRGFVRIINHSNRAGDVRIEAIDDTGMSQTITLSLDARRTQHFNSDDLEDGNAGKGLTGSTGTGTGDWRLVLTSDLDIEVLSYDRHVSGFLTAMHDVAPVEADGIRIAILNPGANPAYASYLRLINPSEADAEVTLEGVDDQGQSPGGKVQIAVPAGAAVGYGAWQLESGDSDFDGALGDGVGKWRLTVMSEDPVVAMSLLDGGLFTNLSTVPPPPLNGVYAVPLFPAANDPSQRQGFLRVVNFSEMPGEVRVQAYDDSQRDYEAITLTLDPGQTQTFNSDDLEQGNPAKGLSGATGAGEGDWRLELTSELDIDVLPYIRTIKDGFLTSMLDVLPSTGNRHRAAIFNPGSNREQVSLLRVVNPGDTDAQVSVQGIDDRGNPGDSPVWFSVPAKGARTVDAEELETGGGDVSGALGDGSGKWQLIVNGDRPLIAMSLLRSPKGHLTNLSTAPVRGAMNLPPEPSSGELAVELVRSEI